MAAAIASTTSVVTDQTTAANDVTANDMTLLDDAAYTHEGTAYFYGADTPYRILWLNVGTAAEAAVTLTWQYYSSASASWVALAGVVDNTVAYTVSGTSTVSWTMPYDMGTTTVGSRVAYWVRAREAVTGENPIGMPLGTQAYYETGQWWAYADSMGTNDAKNYTLSLGGAQDLVSNHQTFVGQNGVTTTDATGLELAANQWQIRVDGFIATDATTTDGVAPRRLAYKAGAVNVYVSAVNTITATLTGTTTTASVSIWAVSEGDHTIAVQSVGGEISISSDGVSSTSTAPALTIADTADDWSWGTGDSVLWFDSIKLRRYVDGYLAFRMDGSTGADTYTWSANPTTNYGTENRVFPITCEALCAPDVYRYAYLEWDISDLPSTAVVTRATTTLYSLGVNASVLTGTLSQVAGAWTETTLTYATAPAAGAVVATASIPVTAANVTWDVSTGVAEWVAGTTTDNGFVLSVSDATGGATGTSHPAREWTTASQRPLLEVAFTDTAAFDGTWSDAFNALWYQLYQPPTVLLQDESGGSHSGRLYWPAEPTGLGSPATTTYLAVTSTLLASVNTPAALTVGAQVPSVVSPVEALPQAFATGTGASIPILGPALAPFFAQANVPMRFFAILFAIATTVGAGAGAVKMMSLRAGLVVMGIMLVAWSFLGGGIVPMWTLFVYVPAAGVAWLAEDKIA